MPNNLYYQLQKYLSNSNVIAFRNLITYTEGTEKYLYNTLVGATRFTDLSKHPAIAVKLGKLNSSAAGRYQFMIHVPGYKFADTWNVCKKALDLKDFAKDSQDVAFIYLLKKRNALDDIIKGNFFVALNKLTPEWASLPVVYPIDLGKNNTFYNKSYHGQHSKTIEVCKSKYLSFGGIISYDIDKKKILITNQNNKQNNRFNKIFFLSLFIIIYLKTK